MNVYASSLKAERLCAALSLVAAILLLAFLVRAATLEHQSMWRDEVDALCYAYAFPRALRAALASGVPVDGWTPCACPPMPIEGVSTEGTSLLAVGGEMIRHNGPLYYFLLRGWIGVVGYSVTALRFFSLWFGVLCVALTYALGRRLLGRTASVWSALLVAVSPYLVWYSQEVKMYTLLPALALLAIYGLRRAVTSGRRRWWAVVVTAASLALYVHIWSALLIPVLMITFLLWWPLSRRHLTGGLVSLALLTLPYLPLVAWQARHVFVVRETGFPVYTLEQMVRVLLAGWSAGVTGWAWPWAGIALAAVALLGLIVSTPTRARGPAWSLVAWVALPLLGIWFVSRWQPLFTDRYLTWAAPALYLLAGAGLAFLWRWGRWPALPLLAVLLVVSAGNLWSQATRPIKADMRAAAGFVAGQHRAEDLLVFQIPHGRYSFDYYFVPDEYAWVEGLYSNRIAPDGSYQLSERQAGRDVAALVRGHTRVWLVATEVDMWDRRHLVQGWLDTHGERAAEARFTHVDVYLYLLPP